MTATLIARQATAMQGPAHSAGRRTSRPRAALVRAAAASDAAHPGTLREPPTGASAGAPAQAQTSMVELARSYMDRRPTLSSLVSLFNGRLSMM